jgi:hypothetical protein
MDYAGNTAAAADIEVAEAEVRRGVRQQKLLVAFEFGEQQIFGTHFGYLARECVKHQLFHFRVGQAFARSAFGRRNSITRQHSGFLLLAIPAEGLICPWLLARVGISVRNQATVCKRIGPVQVSTCLRRSRTRGFVLFERRDVKVRLTFIAISNESAAPKTTTRKRACSNRAAAARGL